MRRIRTRYVLECIIHALFWAGAYYAVRALTVTSVKILVSNNGQADRPMSMSMLFPYAKPLLVFIAGLFYSNILLVFNLAMRCERRIIAAFVIFGWSLLLYAANYWFIRALITGQYGHHITSNPPLAPPSRLLAQPAMQPVSLGDWAQMQGTVALLFLSVMGIALAYYFTRQWVRNDLVRERAKAAQLDTELKFLRAQVNPHFLFNTLNNLFSMAQKKGNEQLADSISTLSGMMRYMLYESNTDRVPLQKEIDYLIACIALNQLRYATNEAMVNFHYPIPDILASVQTAPMLFIPFVENAFKHGILPEQSAAIDIGIAVNQNLLTFTCINPDRGAVNKLQEENGGIGLANVQRRLELVYPGKHTLSRRTENGNYIIQLQIDLS